MEATIVVRGWMLWLKMKQLPEGNQFLEVQKVKEIDFYDAGTDCMTLQKKR